MYMCEKGEGKLTEGGKRGFICGENTSNTESEREDGWEIIDKINNPHQKGIYVADKVEIEDYYMVEMTQGGN